jgi:ADP-ribose pyrophosphatase
MNQEFISLAETQQTTEAVFDGSLLHVVRDTVTLPNSGTATREVIRHVGAVAIVPLTENNEVIIERQFRYPINEVITEIPAGKLDSKEEDRLHAAKRELKEETGITADEWMELGDYLPACAYTDERITLYIARGLHFGDQKLDEDEFLNIKKVPLETLIQEIMDGKICDGKTQAALLKAARILGI